MAAAGPAANFVLALLAALAMRVGIATGHFDLPAGGITLETLVTAESGVAQGLALFLSVLFSINLILCCFNLIPLPPLDGYAMVPLVLNDRMRDKWFSLFSGGGALMGLILAWVLFDRLFTEFQVPQEGIGIAFRVVFEDRVERGLDQGNS